MYRNELKFFINAHQKNVLRAKLSAVCQRDPFSDATGGYLVSSLYFDDYDQSSLVDKLSGVRERKKYRLRVYNHQSNVIKLERKIKRDTVIDKTHLQLSRDEYDALVEGQADFLSSKKDGLAREFHLYHRTRDLRPRVVVEYRREAFIYPYGDVRVTFDQFLRAGVYKNDLFSDAYMLPVIPQDPIILEVKYTGYFPDVIRNIIQTNSLPRLSISKYALCCVRGMYT